MPDEAPAPPLVLIVDDDRDTRDMYSETLRLRGYSVVEAADSKHALEKARALRPDFVVTDVKMPGPMDGWELARTLKADERTSSAFLIALTGAVADDERDARAQQSGIDLVLTKPCLPDELFEELRRLLARARLARMRSDGELQKAERLRGRSSELLKKSDALQHRFGKPAPPKDK